MSDEEVCTSAVFRKH